MTQGSRSGLARVLLLALVLLVSCAPPLAFGVAPTFTTAERAEIQQAADAWNRLTVPEKRITLAGGAWRIREEAHSSGFNGWCSRDERLIFIHPDPGGGASTFAVALHEFGHALGLDHTKTGVMMALEVSIEFTVEVMAECRRVRACSPAPRLAYIETQDCRL